ncbi:G-protein coupled receptor GRL101 [Stylophora pistillata]|uniref:G-protein coupled receptor GRL101 n=1 Tax=Stylophora pistillata TaxID=50429 RepID=A0A2B4RH37_STYPI|nr:G-protein coupled receptor GRL101 [Stylophora pistillata]
MENNSLVTLSPHQFQGLSKLKDLALYENDIQYLPRGVFKGLTNMQSIYFHYNEMRELPAGFFSNMKNLITATVDTNLMCCHLTKEDADCDFVYFDSFASCETMFRNRAPRICLWVVGILSLVGAVFVIVWRLVFKETKEKNKIQSIMLIHLAGSDGLMGVYLIIIGVMDAIWAGQYFLHDYNWRSSLSCQITGAIAVLSSEVSVMTICLISADRVKNILFPYRGKSLTIKATHLLCHLIWIVGGIIAFIPTVGIDYFGSRQKGHHFYGRSVVCLPLQLSAEKPSGWEYSVAMFVGLNFALVFSVMVAYSMIIYTSCTSNRRMAKQGTERERRLKAKKRAADLKREASLAKRVFFIVLTDCVCWLPIVVIGMRSLLEKSFRTPGDLAVWIAVFILPVNSAINPILYTLSTKQAKMRAWKCESSKKTLKYKNKSSVELIAQLQQMQLDASKANNKTDLKTELKEIASDKGFRFVNNEGSGNCMFYALSDQLEIAMRIKIKHDELRQILVQYLRKNPKLPSGTDLFHFVHGHQSWADYLTYMEQDGAWGDHVILCAAANCYKTCIRVVSSLNASHDVILRPQCPVVKGRTLVLGHIREVHYVSLHSTQVQNQEEVGSVDDSEDELQEERIEREQRAGSGEDNEEPDELQQVEPEQDEEPKQAQDELTEQQQVEPERDEEPKQGQDEHTEQQQLERENEEQKQGQNETSEQEQVEFKRDEAPNDDQEQPITKLEAGPGHSKGHREVSEQQPEDHELNKDHENPEREQDETAEERPEGEGQESKQQRTQKEEEKELKFDHGLEGGAKKEKSKRIQKESEQQPEGNEPDEQEQELKHEETENQQVDSDQGGREKDHKGPKQVEIEQEKPRGVCEEANQVQLHDKKQHSKRDNEDSQHRGEESMEDESPRHQ